MKSDLGTGFNIAKALKAASRSAGTYPTASIDHSAGETGLFIVNAGSVGTSLNAVLQYSDDDSDWTNVSAADSDGGNDTAITELTDEGVQTVNIPNPLGRYSRLMCTASGTCVFAVDYLVGPLRSVSP